MGNCPECGEELTEEMMDANMCWECGHILDDSMIDGETLKEIELQSEQNSIYQQAIIEHKLTTGYDFKGYDIVAYKGLVSGEIVMGTGILSDFKAGVSDLLGVQSRAYAKKMKRSKNAAVYEMIQDSKEKKGNAIIGISYSYFGLSGNMIGVSVNGTSVRIEKMQE